MLKYALVLLFSAVPVSASDFNLDSLKASDLAAESPAAIAAPAVPEDAQVPLAKASYIQMTSATRLKMDKEKGELTVTFPKVEFGDASPSDKAHLFVKILRETPAPVISWATVLCSGETYLGYKGSTMNFPEASGSFSVSETLALGYPKLLISRTHPWLAGELASPEEACSPGFLEKMKDARAETLPAKIGNFSFEYNARKNTLNAKW